MTPLTTKQLKTLFPHAPNVDRLAEALNLLLPQYQINTKPRIAGFLAQAGHESAGFTRFEENLNYSADGLQKTFGKYFKSRTKAEAYAKHPESIANYVYANRMGNGPENSGDGWLYRGRGAIQLTGKDNYERFAKHLATVPSVIIEYLCTLQGAIESACFFWENNRINKHCDNRDLEAMTRAVNGGTNGLAERKAIYFHAMELL